MNLPDPEIIQEIVNGQLVLIPTTAAWEQLRNNPVVAGREIPWATFGVDEDLTFVAKYPRQFTLGLFVPGPQHGWFPLLLFPRLREVAARTCCMANMRCVRLARSYSRPAGLGPLFQCARQKGCYNHGWIDPSGALPAMQQPH